MIFFGISSASIPYSFIAKKDIQKKDDYMLLNGTVKRIDYSVHSTHGRTSTTTYYALLDVNEYPNFTFYAEDGYAFDSKEIEDITIKFKVGDTLKMWIRKSSYQGKITQKMPVFPKNPKNMNERLIKANYKFVEVFGFYKGQQELYPLDKYLKQYNSPAGFFSYLFLGLAMIPIIIGGIIIIIIYRKMR